MLFGIGSMNIGLMVFGLIFQRVLLKIILLVILLRGGSMMRRVLISGRVMGILFGHRILMLI